MHLPYMLSPWNPIFSHLNLIFSPWNPIFPLEILFSHTSLTFCLLEIISSHLEISWIPVSPKFQFSSKKSHLHTLHSHVPSSHLLSLKSLLSISYWSIRRHPPTGKGQVNMPYSLRDLKQMMKHSKASTTTQIMYTMYSLYCGFSCHVEISPKYVYSMYSLNCRVSCHVQISPNIGVHNVLYSLYCRVTLVNIPETRCTKCTLCTAGSAATCRFTQK